MSNPRISLILPIQFILALLQSIDNQRIMPACIARLLRALPVIFLLCQTVRAAVPVAPYFNGVFPEFAPNETFWTTRNAFPNLTFTDALWMQQIPGSSELVVLEKGGKIHRFPNDAGVTPAQRTVVLDIADRIQIADEIGLLRMVFHPKFGDAASPFRNDVFLCYSHRPAGTPASTATSMWRISRFKWVPASQTIDPASEEVLIQQFDPHGWHNGGALAFDNNGYLLITCGDGGTNHQSGAWLDQGFFSGVLRIDVDNNPERSHPIRRQPRQTLSMPAKYPASFTQGYGIPNDNPWISTSGSSLEEFYALGLRSPHSAFYDPVGGDLWIGDVGSTQFEEINRLAKGANYGWPYIEGLVRSGNNFSLIGIETAPYFAYDRTVGGCVIGGLRYRGDRWSNQLGGKILFADNGRGTLHALTPSAPGAPAAHQMLTADLGSATYFGISNLATDSAGNIYALKLNGAGKDGATIRILDRPAPLPDPPSLLSQTGLFDDTTALIPSPALVSYEVASPLWSDGALKRRWIALPNDGVRDQSKEKIGYSPTNNWSFPEGTIMVKHFEIPLDARNPALVKRLETRVMVCFSGYRKYGLTYRWNEQGTDATLISGGEQESFDVIDEDGATRRQLWSYPSRANCMECHTDSSGQSLGLRSHQISRLVAPPGGGPPVNQLALFNQENMFHYNVTEEYIQRTAPAKPINDETIPLEHRVRSYLDTNCAHCHQPGTGANFFDARLQTPLKAQGLVNTSLKGHFPLPGGSYLKPGNTALSATHVRAISSVPGIAMPPLGRHVVDEEAMAALTEYIEGLTDQEFAPNSLGKIPVRSSIAGPTHSPGGEFPVTIVFDAALSSLNGWRIQVTNGAVKSLTASGSYYYTAIISAHSPAVSVQVIGGEGSGNFPAVNNSKILNVTSDLEGPPIPFFSQLPEAIHGPFEVTLAFNKPCTGLTPSDLSVTHGKVEMMIPQPGNRYRLIISPTYKSAVTVKLADHAVIGVDGTPMEKGLAVELSYKQVQLEFEAEYASERRGVVAATDPAASNGSYIWAPKGTRDGVTSADFRNYGFTFMLVTPYAGDYLVKAWTRADDAGSNSFHLGIASTFGVPPFLPWTTNQGPGEIGSRTFHEGLAGAEGSAPYVFSIGGPTSWSWLYIAAGEDGTRLDRVELLPMRPFPRLSLLTPAPGTDLKANVSFTSPVTGLEIEHFEAIGGSVSSISGSGHAYTIVLRPYSSKMAVRLKENTAVDASGNPCTASWFLVASLPDGNYTDWAASFGLGASVSDDETDADGDGMSQLMEYALGLNPRYAEPRSFDPDLFFTRGLPHFSLETSGDGKHHLVMTYRRRMYEATVAYQAEFADAPGTFSPATSNGVAIPIGDCWEEVRVRDEEASGTDSRRFGRLKVTRK